MPRSRSSGLESSSAVLRDLAVAEVAALAQQGIDQRRLAVVDVGDDGDIADVVTHLVHDYRLGSGRSGCELKRPSAGGGGARQLCSSMLVPLSLPCWAGRGEHHQATRQIALVSSIVTPEAADRPARETVELWTRCRSDRSACGAARALACAGCADELRHDELSKRFRGRRPACDSVQLQTRKRSSTYFRWWIC